MYVTIVLKKSLKSWMRSMISGLIYIINIIEKDSLFNGVLIL